MERLPTRAGGGCDPKMATPDQMYDLVVCGRVAELPGSSGEHSKGEEESGEGLGGGPSGGRVVPLDQPEEKKVDVGKKRPDERERSDGTGVGLSSSGSGGGGGGGAGGRRRHRGRGNDGDGGGGGAAVNGGISGSGKPHVTFRSLLERLQAKDDPRDVTAAAAVAADSQRMPPPLLQPPLSHASSFHMDSWVSPPLSRNGSNASMSSDVGGGGRRQDPRLSPGRPFASPGPRGVRRGNFAPGAVGGRVGGEGDGGGAGPIVGGSADDDHAEDFDSRLVGEALKMSMKRKVGVTRVLGLTSREGGQWTGG